MYYDNTRLSSARTCLRKYYFRHVRHWTIDGASAALVFGASWHSAMDVVWSHAIDLLTGNLTKEEVIFRALVAFENKWVEEGFKPFCDLDLEDEQRLAPRTPGVAGELLSNYIDTRLPFFERIEVLEVEKPFAVPLAPFGPHFYVGRIDKTFRMENRVYAGEHKTTTAYKKEGPFKYSFLDSFSPNAQIDGYLHALHMLYGDEAKGCLVDAVLVHKKIWNGFTFIPIERMLEQLDAWIFEVIFYITLIDNAMKQLESVEPGDSFLAVFPKNTESCGDYEGCMYRKVCKSWPNPHREDCPDGFIVKKWEPFDELKLDSIGLEKEEE